MLHYEIAPVISERFLGHMRDPEVAPGFLEPPSRFAGQLGLRVFRHPG
jgi:hypothetical protein